MNAAQYDALDKHGDQIKKLIERQIQVSTELEKAEAALVEEKQKVEPYRIAYIEARKALDEILLKNAYVTEHAAEFQRRMLACSKALKEYEQSAENITVLANTARGLLEKLADARKQFAAERTKLMGRLPQGSPPPDPPEEPADGA